MRVACRALSGLVLQMFQDAPILCSEYLSLRDHLRRTTLTGGSHTFACTCRPRPNPSHQKLTTDPEVIDSYR